MAKLKYHSMIITIDSAAGENEGLCKCDLDVLKFLTDEGILARGSSNHRIVLIHSNYRTINDLLTLLHFLDF